jgi:hypothetical protein
MVERRRPKPPRGALVVPWAGLRGTPFRGMVRVMAVRLHRCSGTFVKLAGHPCWKVQKALDDAGIHYELVKGPVRRSKRDEVERLSGQRKYPVIEFEDGSAYREESGDMATTIAAGRLDEKRARPSDSPATDPGIS